MKFVRIKIPENKGIDVPQSFSVDGVKVFKGGTGTVVNNAGILSKLRKLGGKNIETSKEPFEVAPPRKGGVMNLDKGEMEYPPEEKTEVPDYDEFTVEALKKRVEARKIEVPTGAKKADLIALLVADDEKKQTGTPPSE